jgi:ATP-dependent DNA helicase RecG
MILNKYNLVRTFEMARSIHQPRTFEDIARAERRIIFDNLFEMAFKMCYDNSQKSKVTDISCPNANTVKEFLNSLPFSLTDGEGGQLSVVRSIYKKMRAGKRTSSLVQGDVGCGKTMVALLLMLIMAENGYQSVLMAPTNILAKQHYEEFTSRLAMFPFIKTVLVNGSMKKKEKEKAINAIKSGEANIIVGTHAVISKDIEFKNLALSIVDEEHRFGVAQRRLLNEKTSGSIHTVTMSATPIPRSLGMSIYGEDTDIYNITQMPAGRKKIVTVIETEIKKNYDFIAREIKKGRQAYVICPLINESDSERLVGVDSVVETEKELRDYFKHNSEIKIGVINGKMKSSEVATEIQKFKDLEYNIIVSTTIVEVGVNVPNSTVILIKNSERFGLAQLHQLRGRVGRGNHQSYCLLSTPKEDVERLEIMTQTNNGFVIAERDLELRGMGDFIGTSQTGDFKNVMLMLANKSLYEEIKNTVWEILKDPKRTQRYEFLLNKNINEEED